MVFRGTEWFRALVLLLLPNCTHNTIRLHVSVLVLLVEVTQTSHGFIKTKVTGDTAIMTEVEDFSNRLPRYAKFTIVDERIFLYEKFGE